VFNLTFEYRWVTVFHKKARMAVPKLVKNGIYSPFALLTCSLFPFAVQAARSDPNARKGIKTIFYHFRNTHARS